MINCIQIIRDIQYYFNPSPWFLSEEFKHQEDTLQKEWVYYLEFLKNFDSQNEYLAAAKARTHIMQFVVDHDMLNKKKESNVDELIELQNMVYNFNYLYDKYDWQKYHLRLITNEEIEPLADNTAETIFSDPEPSIFDDITFDENVVESIFTGASPTTQNDVLIGGGHQVDVDSNQYSMLILGDGTEIYDQTMNIYDDMTIDEENYFPNTDDIPTEPQYPEYHVLPARENLKISVLDMINSYYIAKKAYHQIGSPIIYCAETIDNLLKQVNALPDTDEFIRELQSMCDFPKSLLIDREILIDAQEVIKAKQKLFDLTENIDKIKQNSQIVTNLKEKDEIWLTPDDLQAIITISNL